MEERRQSSGEFAAYVPICGALATAVTKMKGPDSSVSSVTIELDPYAETAKAIGATPVWIFHAAIDKSVPVEESCKMALALQAVKANVRYTEYPDVGHESWDKAYAEPELVPWLLSHEVQH